MLMTIPGHSPDLLTQSRLLQWYLAPLRTVSASSLETQWPGSSQTWHAVWALTTDDALLPMELTTEALQTQ